MSIRRFVLNVKRAETPAYAFLKKSAKLLLTFSLPLPAVIKPFFRVLYHLHFFVIRSLRHIFSFFYRSILFRARCQTVGKHLYLQELPEVTGTVEIVIGDYVTVSGNLGVSSGRVFEKPNLLIGNHVFIGHRVTFSVAERIVVEEGAGIAGRCYITDNDQHPSDISRRLAGLPPTPEEVKPVTICRNAWLGRGCFILKGVTIGEGAIVSAGSVVTANVPPFSVAMGNPARIVQKLKPY